MISRAAALAIKTRGVAHTHTASALWRLAQLHHDLGHLDRAGPFFRQAIEAAENGQAPAPIRSRHLRHLGDWHQDQGRFREAEEVYQRALDTVREAGAGESTNAADVLRRLAQNAANLGRRAEAETLYRQALAIAEKAYGPEHLSVAETLAWEGAFYRETGRAAESSAAHERADAILQKALPRGPLTHPARVQNATILLLAGRRAEARPLVTRILTTGYRRPGFLELCRRNQIPAPR